MCLELINVLLVIVDRGFELVCLVLGDCDETVRDVFLNVCEYTECGDVTRCPVAGYGSESKEGIG